MQITRTFAVAVFLLSASCATPAADLPEATRTAIDLRARAWVAALARFDTAALDSLSTSDTALRDAALLQSVPPGASTPAPLGAFSRPSAVVNVLSVYGDTA